MKVYKCRFGEVTIDYHSDIPQVEVIIESYDGSKFIRKGWLSPFRGYRFQVSGTRNGRGDYGSSPVMRYSKELASVHPTLIEDLLRGQAIIAVEHFLYSAFVTEDLEDLTEAEGDTQYVIDRPDYYVSTWREDNQEFNEFMRLAVDWAMSKNWN